jgi:hypothetical protein
VLVSVFVAVFVSMFIGTHYPVVVRTVLSTGQRRSEPRHRDRG